MTLFINGTRFRRPLGATIAGMAQLRPLVEAGQDMVLARAIARLAAQHIDDHHAGLCAPSRQPPVSKAWAQVREERKTAKKEGWRCPDFDISCTWTLFEQGAQTLGIFMCEQQGLQGIFTALDAQDWSWGRYERPDDVSPEEWHARAAHWTALLGGCAQWRPAYRGVTYAYDEERPAPTITQVLDHLPDIKQRATHIARGLVARDATAGMADTDIHALTQAVSASLGDIPRVERRKQEVLRAGLPALTHHALTTPTTKATP